MLMINTPHGYKHNDQGKYAKELKEKLEKMCQSRQEESLVRFGSMISLGILEAGGRNQTIQLFSKYTSTKRNASIAGMLLFTILIMVSLYIIYSNDIETCSIYGNEWRA